MIRSRESIEVKPCCEDKVSSCVPTSRGLTNILRLQLSKQSLFSAECMQLVLRGVEIPAGVASWDCRAIHSNRARHNSQRSVRPAGNHAHTVAGKISPHVVLNTGQPHPVLCRQQCTMVLPRRRGLATGPALANLCSHWGTVANSWHNTIDSLHPVSCQLQLGHIAGWDNGGGKAAPQQ